MLTQATANTSVVVHGAGFWATVKRKRHALSARDASNQWVFQKRMFLDHSNRIRAVILEQQLARLIFRGILERSGGLAPGDLNNFVQAGASVTNATGMFTPDLAKPANKTPPGFLSAIFAFFPASQACRRKTEASAAQVSNLALPQRRIWRWRRLQPEHRIAAPINRRSVPIASAMVRLETATVFPR
jgi:hypothetical protein